MEPWLSSIKLGIEVFQKVQNTTMFLSYLFSFGMQSYFYKNTLHANI